MPVKRFRLRFVAMRERLEEEPEPDEEPDEPDEPSAVATAPGMQVPSVADGGGREHEYRTELLAVDEIVDGKSLADLLTKSSSDGWDLVDIINAGDRYAILLRRAKRPERNSRPVGFTPPRS